MLVNCYSEEDIALDDSLISKETRNQENNGVIIQFTNIGLYILK